MPLDPFDFEYVRETFAEFHRKIGEVETMLDTVSRDRLVQGLGYVLSNSKLETVQEETAKAWLYAAVEEFSRRCVLVDLHCGTLSRLRQDFVVAVDEVMGG